MENFKSLKNYYEDLVKKVANSDSSRFLNSDRAHNAVVMSVILENSAHIKMFCGELSIFATSFAKKVNDALKSEEDKEFDPMGRLYLSLKNFLSNGSNTLTIILQNERKDFLEGSEVKNDIINNDKVKIYSLKSSDIALNIDHFTVAEEKMYRREIDKETHEAICCFNNSEGSKILLSTFDLLLKQANPFSINN